MTPTARESDLSEDALLAPVREGETVAGKYVAGPVLGVGGMGVVVAALDKVLDRKVAIKFLLPRLASSDRAVARFVREARAATRITSEHVVRLLEIDKLPTGMPFFVMEYLEGTDLRAVLTDSGPLQPSLAADYVLQALQAVAEGHLHGIVHRDLKPSNLFVTYRADGTPLIKVLDFGIAKTLEAEGADEMNLTGSDDVKLGSPAYMPPEQIQNPGQVDTRSDIWALGVTLYELVTGSQPFSGQTYADLVYRITTAAPEPPAKRRPDTDLPKALEAVILQCLEKDRSKRFANAVELAKALAPFGSDDARVSLRRVKGLGAPAASQVVPGSDARRQKAAEMCTTTLPVAGEAQLLGRRFTDVRITQSSASRRGRSGLIAFLVIGAIALGALLWRKRPPPEEHRSVTATVPAVQPPPVIPAPVKAVEPQLSPPSMPEPPPKPSVSEPVLEKPEPVQPKRVSVEAALASAGVASKAKVVTVASSSAPAKVEERPESDKSRSPAIEKLIEQRR